jgi:hypothetical protein
MSAIFMSLPVTERRKMGTSSPSTTMALSPMGLFSFLVCDCSMFSLGPFFFEGRLSGNTSDPPLTSNLELTKGE